MGPTVWELEGPTPILNRCGEWKVRLYGSLSATGVGHGTDNATVMGLMGEWPDAIDPTVIAPRIAELRETNTLQLDGRLPVEFVWARDMLLQGYWFRAARRCVGRSPWGQWRQAIRPSGP